MGPDCICHAGRAIASGDAASIARLDDRARDPDVTGGHCPTPRWSPPQDSHTVRVTLMSPAGTIRHPDDRRPQDSHTVRVTLMSPAGTVRHPR